MTGHNRYRDTLNKSDTKTVPDQPIVYQIRIKGHLGPQWTDWFEGLTVTPEDNGDTLVSDPVDQAALHGLLKKVRDLGLLLISIVRVEPGQAVASDVEQKVETSYSKRRKNESE